MSLLVFVGTGWTPNLARSQQLHVRAVGTTSGAAMTLFTQGLSAPVIRHCVYCPPLRESVLFAFVKRVRFISWRDLWRRKKKKAQEGGVGKRQTLGWQPRKGKKGWDHNCLPGFQCTELGTSRHSVVEIWAVLYFRNSSIKNVLVYTFHREEQTETHIK